MQWTTIAPAIFSLIGVVIGTAGSFAIGYATMRTTREQTRLQQLAELRAERKEIILEYLREMQNAHDLVMRLWHHPETCPPGSELDEEKAARDSELWFHQKKLLLVASNELRTASLRLTETISDALYDTRPEGVNFWDFIDPAQDKYLAAAQKDLGID